MRESGCNLGLNEPKLGGIALKRTLVKIDAHSLAKFFLPFRQKLLERLQLTNTPLPAKSLLTAKRCTQGLHCWRDLSSIETSGCRFTERLR